jgi:arylsulfatase A-like enzyme
MGPRGDVIAELDWTVGEIMTALERNGLTSNTILIFTSDNGPVLDDGYRDAAVEKVGAHKPAGPYRGGKYSNFEAGTRVPLIVRWPQGAKAGVSDALVSQVDFLASLAAITGYQLKTADAPDSFDVRAALLGQRSSGREHLVEQANVLSLRQKQWKLIEPGPGPKINKQTNTELGNDSSPQLYDLRSDPGETRNLAVQEPSRVKQMTAMLNEIRTSGRSRK